MNADNKWMFIQVQTKDGEDGGSGSTGTSPMDQAMDPDSGSK